MNKFNTENIDRLSQSFACDESVRDMLSRSNDSISLTRRNSSQVINKQQRVCARKLTLNCTSTRAIMTLKASRERRQKSISFETEVYMRDWIGRARGYAKSLRGRHSHTAHSVVIFPFHNLITRAAFWLNYEAVKRSGVENFGRAQRERERARRLMNIWLGPILPGKSLLRAPVTEERESAVRARPLWNIQIICLLRQSPLAFGRPCNNNNLRKRRRRCIIRGRRNCTRGLNLFIAERGRGRQVFICAPRAISPIMRAELPLPPPPLIFIVWVLLLFVRPSGIRFFAR